MSTLPSGLQAGAGMSSKGEPMSELLTALHLEVVILDLRIKMLEAIECGWFELAMTMYLLILVRTDELDAYKWAMPDKQWRIYETIHP